MPALEAFLEKHANEMEFCQIELNYLDWTLQQAKEKCELLNRYSIPIWVMEPVRGGKLANLPLPRRKSCTRCGRRPPTRPGRFGGCRRSPA